MNDTARRLNRTRLLLAGVALVLPPVVIALTFMIWRDGLPDRIASHWSDLGAADDSLPTIGVFLTALVGSGIAALVGLVVMALPRVDARTARGTVFWVGMVQGIAAAIWVIPAWLTVQAGTADGAVLGPWILALVACALYGVVPYAIFPRPALPDVSTPEPLNLAPTETGAWTRTVTANIFVWVTVFVIALTAVIYIPATLSGGLDESLGAASFGLVVMLIALVAVASFIRLRVTVDWRGLRVVSLLFGIPLKRIPLERVRAVESTELRPGEWGGWGYRIMPGRSALILRSGPGMIVTTVDDKQFAITLDDPDTPAALLSGLTHHEQPDMSEGTR